MADRRPPARLRDHPDAFRLAVANVIDGLGTYVGLAALIVLAYDSHKLLGSATVLAAHILPGLLVTLFVAPRLQHRSRQGVLLGLNVVGALALVPAVIRPDAYTAVFAAAVLGAVGVANRGVQMAALAEALPLEVRGAWYGLVGSFAQVVQVVGFALGSAMATWLQPRDALALDAVSFLAAAAVILTVRFATPSARDAEESGVVHHEFGSALRVVWSTPLLRMLATVSWVGALIATAPETATPAVTSTGLQPLVMAAAPAGGAIGALIGTRFGVFASTGRSLTLARVSAVSLVVVGLGMHLALQQPEGSASRAAYGIVAHLLIGGFGVWFLGMMAAFSEHTPGQHTVAVGSFMSWSVGAAGGLGGFVLAALGVAGGYLALGLVLLLASAWGLRITTAPGQVPVSPPPDGQRA